MIRAALLSALGLLEIGCSNPVPEQNAPRPEALDAGAEITLASILTEPID